MYLMYPLLMAHANGMQIPVLRTRTASEMARVIASRDMMLANPRLRAYPLSSKERM